MTLGDVVGLSKRSERSLTRAMQFLLLGAMLYGAVTLQSNTIITSGLSLAVTFLPALLRREYRYSMDAGLVLWLTAAVFLHSVGNVFELYVGLPWYDNITHTISASVVAGIGYASFRALELHSAEVDVPSAFRALFILVFVLAAGVVWELFEFGIGVLATATRMPALLIAFSVEDVVSDMVFNTVGGLLVAAGGTGKVGGLVDFLRRRLATMSDR